MKRIFNSGLFFLIVLFIYLTPFFINVIITGRIEFLDLEQDKTTWIAYYSGLAGGGLTLIGVLYTIVINEKHHIENLCIQYKPFVTIINCHKNYSYGHDYIKIELQCKNIGRGEAHLKKIEIICPDSCYINKCISDDIFPNILVTNTTTILNFTFNLKKELIENTLYGSVFELSCLLLIKYNDLYGNPRCSATPLHVKITNLSNEKSRFSVDYDFGNTHFSDIDKDQS